MTQTIRQKQRTGQGQHTENENDFVCSRSNAAAQGRRDILRSRPETGLRSKPEGSVMCSLSCQSQGLHSVNNPHFPDNTWERVLEPNPAVAAFFSSEKFKYNANKTLYFGMPNQAYRFYDNGLIAGKTRWYRLNTIDLEDGKQAYILLSASEPDALIGETDEAGVERLDDANQPHVSIEGVSHKPEDLVHMVFTAMHECEHEDHKWAPRSFILHDAAMYRVNNNDNITTQPEKVVHLPSNNEGDYVARRENGAWRLKFFPNNSIDPEEEHPFAQLKGAIRGMSDAQLFRVAYDLGHVTDDKLQQYIHHDWCGRRAPRVHEAMQPVTPEERSRNVARTGWHRLLMGVRHMAQSQAWRRTWTIRLPAAAAATIITGGIGGSLLTGALYSSLAAGLSFGFEPVVAQYFENRFPKVVGYLGHLRNKTVALVMRSGGQDDNSPENAYKPTHRDLDKARGLKQRMANVVRNLFWLEAPIFRNKRKHYDDKAQENIDYLRDPEQYAQSTYHRIDNARFDMAAIRPLDVAQAGIKPDDIPVWHYTGEQHIGDYVMNYFRGLNSATAHYINPDTPVLKTDKGLILAANTNSNIYYATYDPAFDLSQCEAGDHEVPYANKPAPMPAHIRQRLGESGVLRIAYEKEANGAGQHYDIRHVDTHDLPHAMMRDVHNEGGAYYPCVRSTFRKNAAAEQNGHNKAKIDGQDERPPSNAEAYNRSKMAKYRYRDDIPYAMLFFDRNGFPLNYAEEDDTEKKIDNIPAFTPSAEIIQLFREAEVRRGQNTQPPSHLMIASTSVQAASAEERAKHSIDQQRKKRLRNEFAPVDKPDYRNRQGIISLSNVPVRGRLAHGPD